METIKVYLVSQTPQKSPHSVSYFQTFVLEEPKLDFNLDRIRSELANIKEFMVHQVFLDQEEAEKYRGSLIESEHRDYTLLINKLPNLEAVEKSLLSARG